MTEKAKSKVTAHVDYHLNTYKQIRKEDEYALSEVFSALWRGKWWIGLFVLFSSALSIAIAINIPNIYRAQALVSPVEEDGSNLRGLGAQFGNLAALAGINISGGSKNKTDLAKAVLFSRKFLNDFINRHDLAVPLMAVEGWDESSNSLKIDPSIYDNESQKWIREVEPGKSVSPTNWELYQAIKKLLAVSEDKQTGMITISIETYSPYIAKQWVDWLVEDINTTMKMRDLDEANRNIEFLTKQLTKTSLADMQQVFYQLIEEQTKTLMLAQVQAEYVFEVVDPAVVPEEKAKPKRAFIAVLGAFLGAVIGSIFILFIHFFVKNSR